MSRILYAFQLISIIIAIITVVTNGKRKFPYMFSLIYLLILFHIHFIYHIDDNLFKYVKVSFIIVICMIYECFALFVFFFALPLPSLSLFLVV